MKNRFKTSIARTFAFMAIVSVCTTACSGAKAEGHTYTGNGGVVKIEFKSHGKAFLSTGPVSTPHTYSESGKTLALTCGAEDRFHDRRRRSTHRSAGRLAARLKGKGARSLIRGLPQSFRPGRNRRTRFCGARHGYPHAHAMVVRSQRRSLALPLPLGNRPSPATTTFAIRNASSSGTATATCLNAHDPEDDPLPGHGSAQDRRHRSHGDSTARRSDPEPSGLWSVRGGHVGIECQAKYGGRPVRHGSQRPQPGTADAAARACGSSAKRPPAVRSDADRSRDVPVAPSPRKRPRGLRSIELGPDREAEGSEVNRTS